MNEVLMRAVIESAAFAALSADDVVHPDAAVRHLEDLSTLLKALGPEEKQEFLKYAKQLHHQEQRSGGDARRMEFLVNLGESLGLTD